MKQIYTNTLYERFRKCISDIKDKFGISYKEMSIITGISQSRLHGILNKGYQPTYEEIESITEAFNLDEDDCSELLAAAGRNTKYAPIMCKNKKR